MTKMTPEAVSFASKVETLRSGWPEDLVADAIGSGSKNECCATVLDIR
jgi:hypothetical protein